MSARLSGPEVGRLLVIRFQLLDLYAVASGRGIFHLGQRTDASCHPPKDYSMSGNIKHHPSIVVEDPLAGVAFDILLVEASNLLQ